MSRRRIPRRRRRQALWAAVAVALVAGAAPVWLRWVAGGLALTAMIVIPVYARGAAGAITMKPRQVRMAERKPYTDPDTGEQVRPPRPLVPAWLRAVVYRADRYRCLGCRRKRGRRRPDGSVVKLCLDHIQPYALGFSLTLWNSGTLCDRCNLTKSSYWKSPQGRVYYRAFAHADHMGLAGHITRREMRARWNPLRMLRMGWAYWTRKGR